MPNLAILHLNLHREFFAQIAARTKCIEYRDQTAYWRKRLEGRKYDVIQFRNGYATNAPVMVVEFRGLRRIGSGFRTVPRLNGAKQLRGGPCLRSET